MSEHLDAWEEKLESHFSKLRVQRQSRFAIFALEHDLSESQLSSLQDSVREHCSTAEPSLDHFACWSVYSAELGYSYSGDEFWQSFESATPGWSENGQRPWLRTCFECFCEAFGGAVPGGAWSRHFSIICWPITHAILPIDLQRHLAQTLYQMRRSLTGEILVEPVRLGRLIEAHSWARSDRFRNLTQEHTLVGQIAMSLLADAPETDDQAIIASAQQQILTDLAKEREALEWLREAQRSAHRAHLRGLRIPSSAKDVAPSEKQGEDVPSGVGIRPRIFLIPSEEESWRVGLEIPDLSPLLSSHPEYRDILAKSRVLIEGVSERTKPRGWLLQGMQRVLLRKWPRPDAPLMTFGTPALQLSSLFAAGQIMGTAPVQVFRIAADGCAIAQRSRVVRVPHRYVVACGDEPPAELESLGHRVNLRCEGACAVLLDLQLDPAPDLEEAIRAVGLDVGVTLGVRPVGLPAPYSDGHGFVEWLADEPLRIAVDEDPGFERFEFLLDENESLQIDASSMSREHEGIFVELPLLSPGPHALVVRAQCSGEEEWVEGELEILVRDRSIHRLGSLSRGTLSLELDPAVPTLDDLWSNRISLALDGPENESVVCSLLLHRKLEERPTFVADCPGLVLPISEDRWRRHVAEDLLKNPGVQREAPLAKFAVVQLVAKESGRCSFVCEREFTPVRWLVRENSEGFELELLDDTGGMTTSEVHEYMYDKPADPSRSLAAGVSAVTPDKSGGLYVALAGEYSRSIALPPAAKSLHDLRDLRISPTFQHVERTQHEACRALRVCWYWATASTPGGFSVVVRWWQGLRWMIHRFSHALCGDAWGEMERRCLENDVDVMDPALVSVLAKNEDGAGFAAAVERSISVLGEASAAVRASMLAPLMKTRLGTNVEEANVELALRLASCPGTLAGTRFTASGLVSLFFEQSVVLRASRFVVLMLDSLYGPPRIGVDPPHLGWDW